MTSSTSNTKHRIRKNFGQLNQATKIPNLIEIQKSSYKDHFLQISSAAEERKTRGLQAVLSSLFPIESNNKHSTLDFLHYDLEDPRYEVSECKRRGLSYMAPLKATLRLILWEMDQDTGARSVINIKEQKVYMGEIPLMTDTGTFVINGTERVIVSQMHRSPGVFFDHDHGKGNVAGKFLYSASIIPYRGSWLDLEFDGKDLIFFRIDRKRKLPVTILLKALGMSAQDILDFYYKHITYTKTSKGWSVRFTTELFANTKLVEDFIDFDTGKVLLAAGQRLTPRLARKFIQEGLQNVLINPREMIGKYLATPLVNAKGEVIAKCGDEITEAIFDSMPEGIDNVKTLAISSACGPYIRNTLMLDRIHDQENALIEIFKVVSTTELSTVEVAKNLLNNLFFDSNRYDLSEGGRVKINSRLDINLPESTTVLTPEDIKHILRVLVEIKDGIGEIDDIDHLSNRRVRSVGELIENQFRLGINRITKAADEKMNTLDMNSCMPNDLINSKLLSSVLKEFFGTSQLSQFMDQTNPLSEITHKRKLSALGPGGLNRERAGFEVRDVHHTHYGRICPIETPEGQNIGLINSLATYAKVNKYGFIESPYYRVVDGYITNEMVYLSAIEESRYKIAQANSKFDSNMKLLDDELINCRYNGDFIVVTPQEVDFIDVTPMQVVSVAASLIPFLENDDANRSVMGSNMQRQAVPLLYSEAPFVGTGVESIVAEDSGACIITNYDGVVEYVDASRIVIRRLNEGLPLVDIYNLIKFQGSNHNTCINQVPTVKVGDNVVKGQVIADGPSIDQGEIALGRNVLVAFMSWNGYNFEDSIVISERIVRDDVFTSIHIEEFEVVVQDTKLGPEEITRDIPNISEESLRHLDEVGIVHIGTEVRAGDILVGKVTPKGESSVTSEEKLLRAIFGEKAADVKDSSLYVPPGISGIVTEVRIFVRRGIEKDERLLAIERQSIEQFANERDEELKIIERFVFLKLANLLIGQRSKNRVATIDKGQTISQTVLDTLAQDQKWLIEVEDAEVMHNINELQTHYQQIKDNLEKRFLNRVEQLRAGSDLPQNALKVVKVFIAAKYKLQPGDKMAGRHGSKGVVSRIVAREDMPFLEDGTIVDVILNPLGVPSRMNVGQILETHLGWASANLGKQLGSYIDQYKNHDPESLARIRSSVQQIFAGEELAKQVVNMSDEELIELASTMKDGVHFATPVFDGARVEDVKAMLQLAGQPTSGQVMAIDGRTGEYFDRPITVGYKYIMKLHHLVDDKIHARSVGPYSLVTQQPLGGKSHFGGQRFGEMEVWALEAYGAAYTLQEMLTVKSDDVLGRVAIYESIVRGDYTLKAGIPESFNVTMKEVRSLCLNIQPLEGQVELPQHRERRILPRDLRFIDDEETNLSSGDSTDVSYIED